MCRSISGRGSSAVRFASHTGFYGQQTEVYSVCHIVVKDVQVNGQDVETREPLFFPDLAQEHYNMQCVLSEAQYTGTHS